jgi:oxygen-independent coproporphyrinogen-3 oxidase
LENANEGFGVYVHWPFCLSKCPYCDFNSHVRHSAIDEERYVRAFAAEIAATAARAPGRTVTTIFVGGGTPSLMKPHTVGAILDAIGRHWSVAPDVEVTLEANPTSVEATRFAGYRAAGVNRVSLGVQGARRCVAEGARPAAHRAGSARRGADRAHGFERYSFDLIYARPGQTPERGAPSSRAIDEAAEHLSLYQLTIEQDTPFAALHAAGKLVIPDDDNARALYDVTQDVTARAGLPATRFPTTRGRRRVPAQSRLLALSRICRHRPGAHGRLVIDGERHATATEKRPESWLMRVEANGHGVVSDERLTRAEQADEYLLMGLRLAEGIDPARYAAFAGYPLDPARIAALGAEGMVEATADGRLRVTRAGFPVLDAVVADLAA